MAVFRYSALDPSTGAARRGELTADSAYQVRLALRRMELVPSKVREVRARERLRSRRLEALLVRALRRRRRTRLVELYENLAALLASGTALAPALDLLAGADRGGRRRSSGAGGAGSGAGGPGGTGGTLCRSMGEEIRHGSSLADAMAARPAWFAPVDVALIRAAEHSGETERTLTELAEDLGHSEELQGRLALALAYPAMLLVFGLGVVVFLTTTTLPQLAGVLADADVPLPRTTEILLWFGGFITERWPVALAAAALLGGAGVWLARTPRLARQRLRLPVVGRLLMRTQLAGVGRQMARLLEAGIPFTEALTLVVPTVGNAAIRSGLSGLRDRLMAGASVAAHLSSLDLFEPVFCRVLEVGEESGELSSALKTMSERYRTSARRLLDRLAAILEPAVILVLAALIGFVVYASITPMLRLTQTL